MDPIKDKNGKPTRSERIALPAFDLYSKKIGHGNSDQRISTFAYEIRISPNAISLFSFISLCGFYSRCCPLIETNIKPLRKLQRVFHRKPIPITSWIPSLITLFDDCKNRLVTSPLLLRYDSSKSSFLKSGWSTGWMGYLLMQADESPQSLAALTLLKDTSKCTFGLSLGDSRLRPVFFGSRSNQTFEVHYHSLVCEVACGRWEISCYRKYLWGRSSTGASIVSQFN